MGDPNAAVREVLEGLIEDGPDVGVQVAAYLDGELVVDAWAGEADEASGRLVDGETLFTALSASKGVVSTCIHLLADRGVLSYDDAIADYWPEFSVHGKGEATIGDALTHRVGIPQDPPGFDLTTAGEWDAVCSAVANLEPMWVPGTQVGYHPLTFGWILGEVARRADGRPIAEILQDEICEPLGIEGLFFGVPGREEARAATLKNRPDLELIESELVPSLSNPAEAFNRSEVRRASIPAAGALTNARSLARLYAMLANGGGLDGVRVLSSDAIATATAELPGGATEDPVLSAVFGGVRVFWSLGYQRREGVGPMSGRARAFGYEGMGTVGFADPERGYAFAFLRNLLDWSEHEMDSLNLVARTIDDALGGR